MREGFHSELKRLDGEVVRMGRLVEASVTKAITALTEKDVALARAVVEADNAIDAIYQDIESTCYELLAKQQPVARDLRLILAIFRVIGDLERAGDLTKNVAGIVERGIDLTGIKPVAEVIGKLGLTTKDLLAVSVDAYSTKNLALAGTLDAKDSRVDELYRELVRVLFKTEPESSLELAVNLVLAGRYFERIADHAVNIADWVNYAVTGELV